MAIWIIGIVLALSAVITALIFYRIRTGKRSWEWKISPHELPSPVASNYSPYYQGLRQRYDRVKRDPQDPDAYIATATFYMLYNVFPKEQVADLTMAIQLRPDAADTYRLRARVYMRMRDFNAALADLSKARDLGADISSDLAELERTRHDEDPTGGTL